MLWICVHAFVTMPISREILHDWKPLSNVSWLVRVKCFYYLFIGSVYLRNELNGWIVLEEMIPKIRSLNTESTIRFDLVCISFFLSLDLDRIVPLHLRHVPVNFLFYIFFNNIVLLYFVTITVFCLSSNLIISRRKSLLEFIRYPKMELVIGNDWQ